MVQDLWILYETKLASLYTPTLPLYPLLAEAARRIALGHTHRRGHEVTQADLPESDGEDLFADVASNSDPEGEADREIALAQLGSMLSSARGEPKIGVERFAGLDILKKFTTAEPPRRQKKPRAERQLSANQIRLREIRKRAGKTLGAFAEAIGISEASQRAYEYGVTRDVPEDVMKRAEELAESVEQRRERAASPLVSRPIGELVNVWAERVGVRPDPAVLAPALGNLVSGNTLRRWLTGKHHPTEANLVALDGYSRYGRYYKSAGRAESLWRLVASPIATGDGFLIPEGVFSELSRELQQLSSAEGYIGAEARDALLLLNELAKAGGGFGAGAICLSASVFQPISERMKNSKFWQE